ncbi:hypothetical protein KC799_23215, partial [candidate division KSB1 bacterium]|nr:hypothetical protein [candidate division KSB1 bacterium]
MQLIRQKTEEKLIQALKHYWEEQPTHRCLQLKFSQTDEDIEEWLELLMYELGTQFDDPSLQAY